MTTLQRLNVGWWNLTVRCTVQKLRFSSNLEVRGQKVMITRDKKLTSVAFFGSGPRRRKLCCRPVLRRWENQRMLSSLKLKTAHAVLRVSLLKIQLIHYIIRNLTSYQHDLITQTKTANNISSKNFIKGKPLKIDITFQKQQVMKNQSQRVHMRLHQQLCIWFKRPSLITYREVQNGLHLRSFNFLSCYNENKIKLSK